MWPLDAKLSFSLRTSEPVSAVDQKKQKTLQGKNSQRSKKGREVLFYYSGGNNSEDSIYQQGAERRQQIKCGTPEHR